MKLHLDAAKCDGHGLCYTRTDLFDCDDAGKAVLLVAEPSGSQEDLARIAERSCPARAITITEG